MYSAHRYTSGLYRSALVQLLPSEATDLVAWVIYSTQNFRIASFCEASVDNACQLHITLHALYMYIISCAICYLVCN